MAENASGSAVDTLGFMKRFVVTLVSPDNKQRKVITRMVDTLTITEDIFKNSLYGAVRIIDAVDLLGGGPFDAKSKDAAVFPIIGEEFLEIEILLDGKPPVKLRFAIYRISDIIYKDNNTKKEYTLEFCSEEHLIDATTAIMKSYNQPNSDTAKAILKDYLKNESTDNGKFKKNIVNLQPTKGPQKVVIPRLSPFQAMEFLARRSIAQDTFESGSYLFFENFDGFSFCDVEYLIKKGVDKAKANKKDYEYFYESTLTANQKKEDPQRQFKTITTMQHTVSFDTIQKLKFGMYESDVILYDFINHKTIPTRFRFANNDTRDNNKTLTLGNKEDKSYPENSLTFLKSYISNDDKDVKYTRKFFIAKDTSSTTLDNYLDNVYPARASYFTRLAQNMYTINTFGDTTIRAGDVIMLNIPESQGENNDGGIDKYQSGYYLIGTIRHIFSATTYMTKMDIYKNAIGAQLTNTEEAKNTKVKPTDNKAIAEQAPADQSPEAVEAADPEDPNQKNSSPSVVGFLKGLL